MPTGRLGAMDATRARRGGDDCVFLHHAEEPPRRGARVRARRWPCDTPGSQPRPRPRPLVHGLGEAHDFTIVADDGTPVGCLSVRPEAGEPRRGDLGILVTVPHQGKGHATRAVALALAHAFERLGWVKCEASVFVGNAPSRALFARHGFVLDGTRRRAVCKRGVWRDEWLLGLTREAWDARRDA